MQMKSLMKRLYTGLQPYRRLANLNGSMAKIVKPAGGRILIPRVEVMERYGISRSSLRRYELRGWLTPIRPSRSIRGKAFYTVSEVEALFAMPRARLDRPGYQY